MVRAPFYDENGIKRGAWSSEEDDKLRAYVERCGYWNWRELPKYAGLQRCGKSCRLRWMNYLRPDVKRGHYTSEEESLIIKLHEEHGNKWSLIAANLPGRTDNEIKNYWHTHLKKRKTHNKTPTKSQLRELDRSCDESSQLSHSNNGEMSEAESSINHSPTLDNHDHGAEVVSLAVPILESSQSPTDTSTDYNTSGSSLFISHAYSSQSNADYSSENNNYQSSSLEAFYQEYYTAGSDFWTQPFLSSQNDNDQYPTCFGDGGTSLSHLSFYDDGMDYYFYQ